MNPKDRIKRLEDALMAADLPYMDRNCQCCNKIYIPRNHDSVRCVSCCQTCYYDKRWVHGHLCPAYRSGAPGTYKNSNGDTRTIY